MEILCKGTVSTAPFHKIHYQETRWNYDILRTGASGFSSSSCIFFCTLRVRDHIWKQLSQVVWHSTKEIILHNKIMSAKPHYCNYLNEVQCLFSVGWQRRWLNFWNFLSCNALLHVPYLDVHTIISFQIVRSKKLFYVQLGSWLSILL